MLGHRAFDRPALGDPAPDPGANRVPGEALEQLRQDAVAGRRGDRAVEGQVVLDELVDARAPRHGVDQGAELGDLLRRAPLGRECGRIGFEQSARLEQFEHAAVLVQLDHERQRVEQHGGIKARDVRAVAPADVEDPDEAERTNRLAQGAAREPEPLGEIGLAREPVSGAQLLGDDHLLDPLDRLVGDAHDR